MELVFIYSGVNEACCNVSKSGSAPTTNSSREQHFALWQLHSNDNLNFAVHLAVLRAVFFVPSLCMRCFIQHASTLQGASVWSSLFYGRFIVILKVLIILKTFSGLKTNKHTNLVWAEPYTPFIQEKDCASWEHLSCKSVQPNCICVYSTFIATFY